MIWKLCIVLTLAGTISSGCSATADAPSGDLRLDLRHPDPRIRIESAWQAAESRRQDLVGPLIENLLDRDDSVRFITSIALRKLTGQDFGYRSFGDLRERQEAAGRFRDWHRAREGGGNGEAP